jgi:glutamine amidotransferase
LENQISADPQAVCSAERLIFPGVGQASAAMRVLKERGLDEAIREAFQRGTPILGICIGCQIVLDHSEEGDTPCLGLLPGQCLRFRPSDPSLKIPHMGWNAVTQTRAHPLLAHLRAGDEFYFVHSYYPHPADPAHVYATCDYGGSFPAAIGVDNLFAVQFHTEKSALVGLRLLQNFSTWEG